MTQNKTYIGIELGSTRIKAVLIDESNRILASGIHDWENKFTKGYWTYGEKDIIGGLQSCYKNLKENFYKNYGIILTSPKSIGISAMMHGYIVLDKNDKFLTPFRTWRNTSTKEAVEFLSPYLNFNIPQRWSIAHLYQAILNKEKHINQIEFITTLAGYIHFILTGEKVIGIGDASGMFPIDPSIQNYDQEMMNKTNILFKKAKVPFTFQSIFPKVLVAGDQAGVLTKAGALILDPHGDLKPGIFFAPPEGDAGTGMVATNAVEFNTGNVSAGTSIFGMVVLSKPLSRWYKEIDVVTTPNGLLVAMIHCNNCSTDINKWMDIFKEYNRLMGFKVQEFQLFKKILTNTSKADLDGGSIFSCNYYSGEPITNFYEGRPMLVYHSNSKFNLPNLFKTFLYSSFATLTIGFELLKKEKIKISSIVAHGGIFKTKYIAQTVLSAALNTKIIVNENASEGGPYGMALLTKYIFHNKTKLPTFLSNDVFKHSKLIETMATTNEILGFKKYMKLFKNGLLLEQKAIELFKL